MTGVVNIVAFAIFAVALCWRLDRIRRDGGGVQALAMTTAIGALTLAFVVANHAVARFLNVELFTGVARVLLYGLLAVGVASLIVVFFYSSREAHRQRRAGFEAIPLVVAVIGLQFTMMAMPVDLRTEGLSASTTRNIAFALFFLIASGYLAYGLSQCVRSIAKFLPLAGGYLRISLAILLSSLTLLATGAAIQFGYVSLSMFAAQSVPALMRVSSVLSVAGLGGFLVGISYPLLHSWFRGLRAVLRRRDRYRDLEPLWTLVTGAVPGVVLPSRSGGELRSTPALLFERRVVEIRDGLTQLSPLLPEEFADTDDKHRIDMLRSAARAYRRDGVATGAVRDLLPPDGTSLDDDAEPLLRLSRAF